MKEAFEYLIVTLIREINGAISIYPLEKVDIEKFRRSYQDLINSTPEEPDEFVLGQVARQSGTSIEYWNKFFSAQTHPQNGMQELLLIAAFDYLGLVGWQLSTSIQSESSTKFVFTRKLLAR